MTYWTTPVINTTDANNNIDNTTIEVMQDYNTIALRREVLAVQEIPYTQKSYQQAGALENPDPPRHSGWAFPQIDNPYLQIYHPLSAPDVSQSSASFSNLISQAANPVPTLAQTGMIGALRAPAINEGY